jgi:hypothetical protein
MDTQLSSPSQPVIGPPAPLPCSGSTFPAVYFNADSQPGLANLQDIALENAIIEIFEMVADAYNPDMFQ